MMKNDDDDDNNNNNNNNMMIMFNAYAPCWIYVPLLPRETTDLIKQGSSHLEGVTRGILA